MRGRYAISGEADTVARPGKENERSEAGKSTFMSVGTSPSENGQMVLHGFLLSTVEACERICLSRVTMNFGETVIALSI